MHVRLDIRGIVKQQIEHIVALMLVGANHGGIDRDMVGHQRVGDHPFVQPEVFRRMAGIDRVEARFEFLAVATGMEGVTLVIAKPEYRTWGK